MEQVIIIGSGPAGLTAGIYTARAALKPLLIAGLQPGGQLTTTSIVENWPGAGAEGIDGNELMRKMREQAEHMGTRFLDGRVLTVQKSTLNPGCFTVVTDEAEIETKTVLVATGASAITLGLPDEAKLMGYGLSTCAVCDGFFYRNKAVVVVGGGDSAMEEASYLAKLAASVTLIHRREKFRASASMQERVLANPKIKVILNAQVIDTTRNEQGLTGVVYLKEGTTEKVTVPADGLFMAIGHHPNTDFVKGLCDMDANGYIKVTNGTNTSAVGVFAAGDVEDNQYRQAVTAAGRGCQAALQVERFLSH
jgi:thioredoxin reductase (NADPH)